MPDVVIEQQQQPQQQRSHQPSFHFENFKEEQEEWSYYSQRFEVELAIHGITTTDNEARNLLLSKVGAKAFKVLVDHFKPINVITKTYLEIVEVLNDYYGKKTFVLSERVGFASRYRKENETITQFITSLRGLAGSCDFGTGLNERLRDQLVIGINNFVWQQEVIKEHPDNTATLAQVEATALKLEQANVQAQKLTSYLQQQDSAQTCRVNKKQQQYKTSNKTDYDKTKIRKFKQTNKQCLFCGKEKHHSLEECPAKGKTCSACAKIGHFARVCISSGKLKLPKTKTNTRFVHKEAELSESDSESANSNTSTIRNIKTAKKVMLPVKINELRKEMLYDPGAQYSIIGKKLWMELGKPRLTEAEKLVAYIDLEIETLGTAYVQVEAFEQRKKLPLVVTKKNDIPLFGLDWCLAFDLPMPNGAKICVVQPQNEPTKNITKNNKTKNTEPVDRNLNTVLEQNKELFDGSVGSIKGHMAKIYIPENITPKHCRPRPVPLALQEQVTAEIDRLVQENVLEPINTTNTAIEWATPIVIAVKSSGNVRLCGDFRVTINQHVQVDKYPLPKFEDIVSKLSGGQHFSKIDLKDAYLQLPVHPDSRKYLNSSAVQRCKRQIYST